MIGPQVALANEPTAFGYPRAAEIGVVTIDRGARALEGAKDEPQCPLHGFGHIALTQVLDVADIAHHKAADRPVLRANVYLGDELAAGSEKCPEEKGIARGPLVGQLPHGDFAVLRRVDGHHGVA